MISNAPIVIGILSIFAVAAGLGIYIWRSRPDIYERSLQRRGRFLTSAEKTFFECLSNALSDDFHIFTKVAMLDVMEPSPAAGKLKSRRIRNRLTSERLDYVLCKKQDMSIFGIVELEDFNEQNPKSARLERESLISTVCKAAHLRLFYFDVRQDYQGVDIRRLVTGRSSPANLAVEPPTLGSQFTLDNTAYVAYAKHRACPKCNGEVVTKVALKGEHTGDKYLMCRQYPVCDYKTLMSEKASKPAGKKVARKMEKSA